jgi:hypothetical protein
VVEYSCRRQVLHTLGQWTGQREQQVYFEAHEVGDGEGSEEDMIGPQAVAWTKLLGYLRRTYRKYGWLKFS